jgi:hypothetical protein
MRAMLETAARIDCAKQRRPNPTVGGGMLKACYRRKDRWPPLSWVAELPRGESTVTICHGNGIEIRPDWFCEAIWDGTFAAGGFDRTDLVAGSGGRFRDDKLQLVSSGSTVDRLQFLELPDRVLVSNSLVCLLAYADLSLHPTYRGYATACFSVIRGLDHYTRSIPTTRGSIEFCYFDNLVWDGTSLSRTSKPNANRALSSFTDYRSFLTSALERMFSNMRADERSQQYDPIGTLSTGYDSTFATVLTRPLGLRQVICFEGLEKQDSGADNACLLGVTPTVVPVEAWRSLTMPEIPFIAGDGIGEEVHFSSVEGMLRQRVLVTGYHGDKVWEKDTPYTAPTLVRGDLSGLSLTEFRLWAGFIHCPIAFFGARQVRDIKRISNLPDMAAWDTGRHYSRPICRRVIEEAGVPRSAFGIRKNYASRWFAVNPLYMTEGSTSSYLSWLRAQRKEWLKKGRLPPLRNLRYDRWRIHAVQFLGETLVKVPGYYHLGLNRRKSFQLLTNLDVNDRREDFPLYGFRRYVMPWAVEKAKRRYAPQPEVPEMGLQDRVAARSFGGVDSYAPTGGQATIAQDSSS